MPSHLRDLRRAELRELGRVDPARLIALYRRAAGLDDIHSLPPGATIPSMIEVITDWEIMIGNLKNE